MGPISKLSLLALVLLTLAGAAAVTAEQAIACSCAPIDARERLADGSPALIGHVTDRRKVGSDIGASYEYTVVLEQAFNFSPGSQTKITASTNSASCGFTWTVGKRIGAFVQRTRDGLTTNLCSLVAPAKLEAAAAAIGIPGTGPAPPPDPDPRLRLRASLAGLAVRAGVGPATLVLEEGGRLAMDVGEEPAPIRRRLPIRPRARVKLRVGARAEGVVYRPAGPKGKRFGADRRARRGGASRRTWIARLPRRLNDADRLAVEVTYEDGSQVSFGVGIKRARRATTAGARCAAQPS